MLQSALSPSLRRELSQRASLFSAREGLAMREIHPFVNLYEKGCTGEHSSPVLRNQYLSNVFHGQSDAFSGNVKRFDLYLDAIAYGKHFGGVLDEFF